MKTKKKLSELKAKTQGERMRWQFPSSNEREVVVTRRKREESQHPLQTPGAKASKQWQLKSRSRLVRIVVVVTTNMDFGISEMRYLWYS